MNIERERKNISTKLDYSDISFDAEAITLDGHFKDELSAYRTRKEWEYTLHEYFLLEKDRDYSMEVTSAPEIENHNLRCVFTSACGRYAFWRLINDQAPEAKFQLKQGNSINKRTAESILKALKNLSEKSPDKNKAKKKSGLSLKLHQALSHVKYFFV
jgi:hypothetical protein